MKIKLKTGTPKPAGRNKLILYYHSEWVTTGYYRDGKFIGEDLQELPEPKGHCYLYKLEFTGAEESLCGQYKKNKIMIQKDDELYFSADDAIEKHNQAMQALSEPSYTVAEIREAFLKLFRAGELSGQDDLVADKLIKALQNQDES